MTKPAFNREESATVDVLEAIARRRAVRSYTDDPVPRDVVDTLLDAAVHAPTAMHLEPWQFVVIQDKQLLLRISDRAKQLATPASAALLLQPSFNIFYNAGTLIAIGVRSHGPFAAADCWLAAQNVMLAAYALGFGTCPIGFAVEALNDRDVKTWLGLPLELTIVAPIIVGVPRGETVTSPRKPPSVVCWK